MLHHLTSTVRYPLCIKATHTTQDITPASGALLATHQHRNTHIRFSIHPHTGVFRLELNCAANIFCFNEPPCPTHRIKDDSTSRLRSGQPPADDVILLPADSCLISVRVSQHPVRQRRPSEDVQLHLGQVQVCVQAGLCGTLLPVHDAWTHRSLVEADSEKDKLRPKIDPKKDTPCPKHDSKPE